MGSAAQLAREGTVPDLDHPHDVAVLLAEQRHRPEPLGFVSVVVSARTGWLSRIQTLTWSSIARNSSRRQRAAVREVEPQLVRAYVGAGLVDVGAEQLPERRVQQMGGGVVALGGVAGGAVYVGVHPLARLERSALGDERHDLIIAEAQHIFDARETVAVVALHVSGVGDLSATGGVERRLDQLHEQTPVVALERSDRRLAVGRLIADEVGGEPGRAGE